MVANFEKQRKEILDLINGEDFISKFFPTYIELRNKSQNINLDILSMNETQQSFNKWVEMGEIIDVEFEDIKQLEQKEL